MTTPLYNMTDSWDAVGTVFKSIQMTIQDDAYAVGSKMIDITSAVAGGIFNVDVDGNMILSGGIVVGGGIAATDDVSTDGNFVSDGSLFLKQQAAAQADVTDYGQIWVKDNGEINYTDEGGVDHVLTGAVSYKSYSMRSPTTSNGEYYQAGFYEAPAAHAALTNASLTQAFGSANNAYAAHAFIVSGGDGATDGSDLVLTVTGTSMTDAGVRTPADSEVIVADALVSGCAVDTYLETSKKWVGVVTFTLSSAGGSTFQFTFNYGLCKYEDYGNRAFTLTDFETVGRAQASDSGFNVQVYHHNAVGWTYSAAAFVAGNANILNMNTIHSTEKNLVSGKYFAFKAAGQTVAIDGAASEGIVVKITTGTNNSVLYLDSHVGVVF